MEGPQNASINSCIVDQFFFRFRALGFEEASQHEDRMRRMRHQNVIIDFAKLFRGVLYFYAGAFEFRAETLNEIFEDVGFGLPPDVAFAAAGEQPSKIKHEVALLNQLPIEEGFEIVRNGAIRIPFEDDVVVP